MGSLLPSTNSKHSLRNYTVFIHSFKRILPKEQKNNILTELQKILKKNDHLSVHQALAVLQDEDTIFEEGALKAIGIPVSNAECDFLWGVLSNNQT